MYFYSSESVRYQICASPGKVILHKSEGPLQISRFYFAKNTMPMENVVAYMFYHVPKFGMDCEKYWNTHAPWSSKGQTLKV